MKKIRRNPLALHRETLLRMERYDPALRQVAGLRPMVTSNGDICSGEIGCMTVSGTGCYPMMAASPEETAG